MSHYLTLSVHESEMHIVLDEEKNGCVARDQLLYAQFIEKGWTRQGFLIWHQREVTREQEPIRALVLFTLERDLCASII